MNDWFDADQRAEKAKELFAQRRWHECLAELRAAIAMNPYNSAWYFNIGLTLDELERFDEAIDAYRTGLKIEAEDVEAIYRVGVDLTRLGRLDEAIASFESIQRIDASFEPSYCGRIIAYTEQGQHEKAEEMFYIARQYKEDCPHCYFSIAASLARRRLFDKAIYCWQKAIDMDGSYPEVHRRIAECLWEKGQFEQARQHFLQELRAAPGDTNTLLELGSLLMQMGRVEEAGEKLRRAIEMSPEEPTVYYCHGRWLLASGRLDAAQESFEQALKLDRRCPGAEMCLGRICLRRGDPIAARRHLRMEVLAGPRDPQILMELANLLLDCNQNRLAVACLKRLTTLQPDYAAAWQNLAVAHFTAGRYAEGIAACHEALRCNPRHTTAMFNLALAWERQGDYLRASRWLRKAAQIDPHDPSIQRLDLRLKLLLRVGSILRVVRKALFWKAQTKC